MGRKYTDDEFRARLMTTNKNIEPLEEYRGAVQKIRCRCRVCSCEWEPRANSLLLGHGCPRCKGVEKYDSETFEKKVKSISPDITMLEPYTNIRTSISVMCGTCGHVWKASPYALLTHIECPGCKAAAAQRKAEQAAEMFKREIEQISPNIEVTGTFEKTNRKVECRCRKCGHVWASFPCNLRSGHGCPACARSRKLTTKEYTERVKEVNPDVDITGEYRGYRFKIRAKCRKCGYEWETLASQLIYGHGCPACRGVRRYTTEEFKDKLAQVNPGIEVLGEYRSTSKKILCKCRTCGHRWRPLPCNILNNRTGCPVCAKARRSALLQERARQKETEEVL